jgi:hypothetical protein
LQDFRISGLQEVIAGRVIAGKVIAGNTGKSGQCPGLPS